MAGLATPLSAQDLEGRPASCEAILTSVNDACSLINHYICDDGANYFETWKDDVLLMREVAGPDYGLGPFVIVSTGEGWAAVNDVVEEFSLSRLLSEGRASGAYLVDAVKVFPVPRPAFVRIDAELTGETREISGVSLRLARLSVEEQITPDGLMTVFDGQLFVDEERGVMIVDYDTTTVAGVRYPGEGQLSQLIQPGESGFLATTAPDCQGLLSLATPLPEPPHG